MIESLEDAVMVLEDAKRIRDEDKADPALAPDVDTEDCVRAALIKEGYSPFESMQLGKIYTRALRIMLSYDVGQQR